MVTQDGSNNQARAGKESMYRQTVNAARGLVKPFGQRLPACDADSLTRACAWGLEPRDLAARDRRAKRPAVIASPEGSQKIY